MGLSNSTEGRWLSPDPLGGDITNPQSLNRYAYALNNPTTLVDPLGLDATNCTPNGQGGLSCSGADSVTVNGGSPPDVGSIVYYVSDGLFGDGGCNVGGCGPSAVYTFARTPGWTPNLFPSRPNNITTSPVLTPGCPTKTCVGKARVLQGNAATIGAPLNHGAFNYNPNPVQVQAGSAAVIPSQFGFASNAQMKPYISQISGIIGNGLASFNSVSDVIGGKPPSGYANVRGYLQHTFPGELILELPSAPKDYGTQPVRLTIPANLPCPTGTHQE